MSVKLLNREFSSIWLIKASEYLPDFPALRRWFESNYLQVDGERVAARHAFRLCQGENDTGIVISTAGNLVCMCYFASCYWATYEYEDHPLDRNSWTKEYEQFHLEYKSQFERVCSELGAPAFERADLLDAHDVPSYMGPLHASSWIFNNCTLVLQQSAYDTQFGLEINYWLHPKPVDIGQATTLPLANWLELIGS